MDTASAQAQMASTMANAVAWAIHEVPGAEAAALTIVHRSGLVDTLAASDDSARYADELQYQLGEGPCLDAVWHDVVVSVPEIGTEERWPAWSQAMRERSGFNSMVCHRMVTVSDRVGALNLYSTRARGFDGDDVDHAETLARHLAVVIRSAQQIAGLQIALDSRAVIGQATGIVMERYGIDAERAFAVLSRLSSHENRKLRVIAAEISQTGTTRGLSAHPDGPGS